MRHPIIGASREWTVLKHLEDISLKAPKPLGFGTQGLNPAKRRSFVVMEALEGMVSLETLAETQPELFHSVRARRRLIRHLASIVGKLHAAGINHRDLYLCHFLVPKGDLNALEELHVIDWHRAQIRKRVPTRWLIKDLASLLFSSWPIPITMNDKRYFIRCYMQQSLKDVWYKQRKFWALIDRKADKLYHEYRKKHLD